MPPTRGVKEQERSNIKWVVGLTDNAENYEHCIGYDSPEKGIRAVNHIIEAYEGTERGTDYGVADDRNVVYLNPVAI